MNYHRMSLQQPKLDSTIQQSENFLGKLLKALTEKFIQSAPGYSANYSITYDICSFIYQIKICIHGVPDGSYTFTTLVSELQLSQAMRSFQSYNPVSTFIDGLVKELSYKLYEAVSEYSDEDDDYDRALFDALIGDGNYDTNGRPCRIFNAIVDDVDQQIQLGLLLPNRKQYEIYNRAEAAGVLSPFYQQFRLYKKARNDYGISDYDDYEVQDWLKGESYNNA